MNLSLLGDYAQQCWREIPSHHKNIDIDEFIIMPNHVHGIIVISGPERLPELRMPGDIVRTPALSEVHPESGSLGAVVGSFKSAVTRWCREQRMMFGWQPRFHDRIIRGGNALKAVREYIWDNPKNWHKDSEFVRED
jgi:REP element-mobilizing transposase RayT